MNVYEKLTGQQFEEILKSVYEKTKSSESLQANELIMEIKQRIISAIESQSKS